MRISVLLLALISSLALAKNPVVLLSIDGLGKDLVDKYQPKNILALAQSGVYSEGLLPVYPSKTFPNHLSIVTGNFSARHGIIHNNFYRPDIEKMYEKGDGAWDPRWLTAPPIWTLAEQQGIKTGIYFWPESEARVDGKLPSYFYRYNQTTPNIQRVNQIIHWLKLHEDVQPELVVAYFSLVDNAAHQFGKNSTEVKAAIEEIDRLIGILLKRLVSEVPQRVDIILVSDHGVIDVDKSNLIQWQELVKRTADAKIINGETQLLIYSRNVKQLNAIQRGFEQYQQRNPEKIHVYLKGRYPNHWRWDRSRLMVPDIVIEATPPFVFTDPETPVNKATHGYDPVSSQEMDAIFIANGPSFQKGQLIPPFENVHIMPLIAHLLGVNIKHRIDGDFSVLQPYVRPDLLPVGQQ